MKLSNDRFMQNKRDISTPRSINDFEALSHRILVNANRSIPKINYLRETLEIMIEFSGCDAVELWLNESDKYTHCAMTYSVRDSFQYEIVQPIKNEMNEIVLFDAKESIYNLLRLNIWQKKHDPSLPFFTEGGSFWTGNTKQPLTCMLKSEEKKYYSNHKLDLQYESLALIPLAVGDKNTGFLQLMSFRQGCFTENDIMLYESHAQILAIALENQHAQAALRERVKELTCLYSIEKVAEKHKISIGEILKSIAEILPPAWQYPESTAARIALDKYSYSTPGFQEDMQKQKSDIIVKGNRRGFIEVAYMKKKPDIDEGPFLKEERDLINAIARQVGLIIERKEAKEQSSLLQEQLRHADRLATIGQLAAGVAHELNEPLGNILGFAQLAKKCPELPDQASRDIDRIVGSSLHAREIIKKLMIFARQTPPKRTQIDLNKMVENELYLFEARCVKAGIELVRLLSPDIPKIAGDQAQLNQVLVNLVVNAIQAMPDGGKLTIKTYVRDNHVFIIVEDTGIGMSEDILKKIFIPFFTTKDVNQGTGLGLAVVHGIVTSHKGSIKVQSKKGQGAIFEIRMPVTAL